MNAANTAIATRESVADGATLYRVSTDAAALCRDIVLATASNIQGRKYVQVEGWQAIALAHGCAASSGDVTRLEDGSVSAIGRVIRIDTGTTIATAEGYVGADEPTWFGGKNAYGKLLPKRPDYAIRAMAQTRAISRACRSAFAHVVVMMNVGLSTTPAEEVPDGGFDRDHHQPPSAPNPPASKVVDVKPAQPPVEFADRAEAALDAETDPAKWLLVLERLFTEAETVDDVRSLRMNEYVRKARSFASADIKKKISDMIRLAMDRMSPQEEPTPEQTAAAADEMAANGAATHAEVQRVSAGLEAKLADKPTEDDDTFPADRP